MQFRDRFRLVRTFAMMLILVFLSGCQMTADVTEGQFAANFGAGDANAKTQKATSTGLSVPGLDMVKDLLDTGMEVFKGAVRLGAPAVVSNAMFPPEPGAVAVVPPHTHPATPIPVPPNTEPQAEAETMEDQLRNAAEFFEARES